MDDFTLTSLHDSRNEWCIRLLNILTTPVFKGVTSIFDEACKICSDTKENNKYLMTFQNLLSRVPKWNQHIVDTEKNRIIETTGCSYLEDLITCVHIIQLKSLTCIRVGSKQKKIDLNIPAVSNFIHEVYIHAARKFYTNIYLFERNISTIQSQKNINQIEIIIKECILDSIRDSIPVETILRAYIGETDENVIDSELSKEVELPPPELPLNTSTIEELEISTPVQVKNLQNVDNYIQTPSSAQPTKSVSINETPTIFKINNNDDNMNASLNTNALNDDDNSNDDANSNDDDDANTEAIKIGDSICLSDLDINFLDVKTPIPPPPVEICIKPQAPLITYTELY